MPAAMINAPPWSRPSGKPVDAVVAIGIAIVMWRPALAWSAPFIDLKNGKEHVFVEFLSTGRTNANFGPQTVARLFERLHESGGSIHLDQARTHPAQLAVIIELHPYLILQGDRIFYDRG